jgi:hypothetical protein
MTVHSTFIGKIIRKQDCAAGIEGISYMCRNCEKQTDPYFAPCNQGDSGGVTDTNPHLQCKLEYGHAGTHVFI